LFRSSHARLTGTLKTDLLATGDKPLKVEGIFSGTLSYIFNTYKPGMSFSEVIEDAKNKGFTEPDPRDDLSGTDVQRKVVILAREMGLDVELKVWARRVGVFLI
jgi:homoserine dehydrogenase